MSCDGSGEFKSVLQDLRTGTFLGTVLVNDRVLPSKNAACTIAIDAPKVPVGSTSSGLFEGRFRSSLIEADTYLLACQRYIELNPVRASMASVPGDYRWSSHRANALGRQDSVVTPHPLYQGLADADQARFAAYRRLFDDMLSAELLQRFRECINGGFVLGSPKFERQIAAMIGRRTWKGAPGRPLKEIDADE
jgi:putative transposase